MRLVPISEELLPACARLFVGVFNSPPWNESWEAEIVELRLTEFFHSAGFYGLVAFEGDEAMGFVLGHAEQWDKSKHFNLREMCVAAHSQRKGLGQSLIEALQTQLAEQGVEQIYLLTARSSPAQSFYEKCGFTVSSRMVLMAKRGFDGSLGEKK
jgi:aminoglycoside 6'-N-acetyltransferase I